MVQMTVSEIFKVIEKQAEQGVDFMTVHCGITREGLEKVKEQGKGFGGCVARGLLHHRMDGLQQQRKSSL
jgi:phosphomethylpyrimidine synthase